MIILYTLLIVAALVALAVVIITGLHRKPVYIIKTIDKNQLEPNYQVWEGKRKLSTWLTIKQAETEIYRDAFTITGATIERK